MKPHPTVRVKFADELYVLGTGFILFSAENIKDGITLLFTSFPKPAGN